MLRAAFIAALFLFEAPSAFLTGVLLSDFPAARLLENNRASNPTDRCGFSQRRLFDEAWAALGDFLQKDGAVGFGLTALGIFHRRVPPRPSA